MITITGSGMCGGKVPSCATAGGEFAFDLGGIQDTQLVVEDLLDDRADLMIPNGAGVGKGAITLTVNGEASNALAFEVTP